MTAIKENSTLNANRKSNQASCPVSFVMSKIGGHWKPIILYHLLSGTKRYSELKKLIPAITEKMLIQHLKQMQEDNLVIREAQNVVPPYVTYSLSKEGEQLRTVLDAMVEWAFAQDFKIDEN
ncbi:winged helix-turn-helix transcriptional regulator [Pedobacter sp. UBA5917]|jgi:DNA-binding HxlR family transcriptional regulator|uniref:winged helix-turn-helix transcriptional regulator n=1 Tax=Pedobacter sp. UBA5917 TaxID=1947061 RepID=UPI0025FFCEB2|nr:helix-turn-helix domain-containing protein [Pedobacter sp. UBA5917]